MTRYDRYIPRNSGVCLINHFSLCSIFITVFLLILLGFIALATAAAFIGLANDWAQPNPATTPYNKHGFLGKPDRDVKDGQVSYHILYMIVFIGLEIYGAIVWCFIGHKGLAQLLHFILELAAIASMGTALKAIYDYKNNRPEAHLTTIHGWIGISCIVSYVVNFAIGFVIGILSAMKCSMMGSGMLKLIRSYHADIGQIALFLTALTVLTGINDQLSSSACYYVDVTLLGPDINPASNYYAMPDACKIANTMGVLVSISTAVAFVAMYYRKLPFMSVKPIAELQGLIPKIYTFEEVAEHNTAASLWCVIHDKVYDITPFVSTHPGTIHYSLLTLT